MKKPWKGRRFRARGVVFVGIAALTCLLALPASGAAKTWTFGYTGGMQSWVVPEGVTSAYFDISGAAGADSNSQYGSKAGKGGRAQSELSLTPGSTVHIAVGGKGTQRDNCCSGAGYNGGGAGSRFGGGGATDIRIGGTSLMNRALVAGGGGGTGNYGGQNGGDGGGLTGGGAGGTQTAGGSGIYPMWSGSFGLGGGTGTSPNATGGGGGGWYGGAAAPGGGGGGSGYGPSGTHFSTGVNGGNGSATIMVFERPPTGLYRGNTAHAHVEFHLSSDYAEVRHFKVGGHELLDTARFHFGAGSDPGSFDVRRDTHDLHLVGDWSKNHLGHVSGYYSYRIGGHRTQATWGAHPAP